MGVKSKTSDLLKKHSLLILREEESDERHGQKLENE